MKECEAGTCLEEHGSDTCGSQGEKHYDDHCAFFLEIADCAWVEVLKEKIKEHIREHDDGHLTELAKIIAEGNKKRWKNKMAGKKECHEFAEELCSFFTAGQKQK